MWFYSKQSLNKFRQKYNVLILLAYADHQTFTVSFPKRERKQKIEVIFKSQEKDNNLKKI